MIDLEACARSLVAPGKGLLALDEDGATIDARLEALGIKGGEKMQRAYRGLFIGTPGIEEYISGVSLCPELLTEFASQIHDRDIVPGVKVDQGLDPMPESARETVTKGLLGLPERLMEYRTKHHTGFTKWRAAFRIHGDTLPSSQALVENAKRLAMYAKHVQETGMVPVLEPEVLFDGEHSRLRAKAVLEDALTALMRALEDQAIDLSGVLLQCSMVRSGKATGHTDAPEAVAKDTIEVLKKVVPRNLLGVVFLSGGQTPDQATANLAAIAREGKEQNVAWPLSFAFSRALTEEALAIWAGKEEHVPAAREAFLARLKSVSLAATGA